MFIFYSPKHEHTYKLQNSTTEIILTFNVKPLITANDIFLFLACLYQLFFTTLFACIIK